MLVLKWLKINCLMLYSQKNKCLVLSKYPHSDPRLTKNKSLKFEVEFFGNVGALSPTRETKVDDKKKLSFDVFTLVLSVGAERPYDLAVVSMPPGSLLKTASGL